MDFEFEEPVRKRRGFSPVWMFVFCAAGLTCMGLLTLLSATFQSKFGTFYYFNKQLIGVGLGLLACGVVSYLNFEGVRKYAVVLGLIMVVILVLVLVPGIGKMVNGSRRWLGFAGIRFQPSEIAKVVMVFCVAHYLALNQGRIREFWRGFVFPMAIIGAFALPVLAEVDMGTAALMVGVGVVLIFLAGMRWLYVALAGGGVVALLGLMVLLIPNRLERFTAFLDVQGNKQDGTYQLYQSLAAFAVGGETGVGLGQGRQQMGFLPEAHTDFILAVLGEEMGLCATLGVVVIFIVMFAAGCVHVRRAPNMFQSLFTGGCLLLVVFQALVNMGVVTGVFPTKGMSLPFVSAGMSNMVLMWVIVGVFINTRKAWNEPGLLDGRWVKEVSS